MEKILYKLVKSEPTIDIYFRKGIIGFSLDKGEYNILGRLEKESENYVGDIAIFKDGKEIDGFATEEEVNEDHELNNTSYEFLMFFEMAINYCNDNI